MNYFKYTGSNLTAATYQNKRLIMCDVWLYDLIERIKTDSYYSKYDIDWVWTDVNSPCQMLFSSIKL